MSLSFNYPEVGGRQILQIGGTYLPIYTVSYPQEFNFLQPQLQFYVFLFFKVLVAGEKCFVTINKNVHFQILYRVIQNDCRGFNNLSYTIHLR